MSEHNTPNFTPASFEREPELPAQERYISGGRVVPAGHGLEWISSAWAMFKQSPGAWIGMYLLFFVICVLISLTPLSITLMILSPLFVGGIMIASERQRESGALNFKDLFAGFEKKPGELLKLGLLYLALILGSVVLLFVLSLIAVAIVMAMGKIFGWEEQASMLTVSALLPFMLVGLMFPLGMLVLFCLAETAMWFAPALVVLKDVSPLEAMKSSFKACMKNWRSGTVYFLVLILLVILAALPLFLGVLALVLQVPAWIEPSTRVMFILAGLSLFLAFLALRPLIYASIYTAYRDIFIEA